MVGHEDEHTVTGAVRFLDLEPVVPAELPEPVPEPPTAALPVAVSLSWPACQ